MFYPPRQILAILLCLLPFWNRVVQAQTVPRVFEVASIKPSGQNMAGTIIAMPPGGRLEIANMSLKEMIVNAYSIQPFQVSGGPGWLDSAHYDISSKAAGESKREDVLLMLQSLLADRFQLVFRREIRQLPVYSMVIAGKGEKPGPKLVPSKEGACTAPDPANPFAVDPMRLCGAFELGPDGLTLVGAPLSSLTPRLSRLVGRTVIDKTGLRQNFDINVEWSPDESLAMQPPSGAPRDTSGPSIFTVFRKELGLDFKVERGPVEIFVIQRAEKPASN
jgi:uncharacterized protein (TIGR03435 family)